jgi:hypothetical protein
MSLFGACMTRLVPKLMRLFQSIVNIAKRVVEQEETVSPPIPNGTIPTSVCLALALHYFAGGAPTDLLCKYGVSHASLFVSVWVVVEAIKNNEEFNFEYSSSHEEQLQIVHSFEKKSKARFHDCAGANDGILIWMHKPNEKEAKISKVD